MQKTRLKLHVYRNSEECLEYLKYIPEQIEVVKHDDISSLLNIGDNMNIPLMGCYELTSSILPLIDYLKNSSNRIIYIHWEHPAVIKKDFIELGLIDLFNQKKIIVVCSGDWDSGLGINIDFCLYLLGSIPYNNKISDVFFEKIYNKKQKPYKFNCLNNMERDHRNKLIEQLKDNNLLSCSLWSYMEKNQFLPNDYKDFCKGTRILSSDQESVTDLSDEQNLKGVMDPDTLLPEIYRDTYFSVVTETSYSIPSARTEKTYKPIQIGHPFIVVSNSGFYKSLKNMGFKTFDGLIDESFDDIEDGELRMKRIVNSIKELCSQDLDSFLFEAKEICRHNKNQFIEIYKNKDHDYKQKFIDLFDTLDKCQN